ncbi:ribosomal protein L1-like protein [Triangularia verruculosa]|uniref:Ribosomal protein n=1 Tax=Triangularia verruculosa TaxID=2587418 RepID=A0AAN6XAX4_9PEZI|nr:ribosomal protein L1-like protein [Triangularia verruculosa]
MAVQSKSKITVAGTRVQVQTLLAHTNSPDNKRNFLETVELQFGLKNYDPRRDKRFSGSVKLPAVPRPHMTVCVLGDQHDLDRAKHQGLDSMSFDDLKKLNRNKKLIKKLARKYDAFVCSESRIREIPRVLGPGLSRAGKFPTPVSHTDDLATRIIDVKSTIKFSLRKELSIAMAIGNVDMSAEQLVANTMITINYLVSCLKKGWQNFNSLTIKSTMSPPHRLF